jgi:hypothetical protein
MEMLLKRENKVVSPRKLNKKQQKWEVAEVVLDNTNRTPATTLKFPSRKKKPKPTSPNSWRKTIVHMVVRIFSISFRVA